MSESKKRYLWITLENGRDDYEGRLLQVFNKEPIECIRNPHTCSSCGTKLSTICYDGSESLMQIYENDSDTVDSFKGTIRTLKYLFPTVVWEFFKPGHCIRIELPEWYNLRHVDPVSNRHWQTLVK